MRWQGSGHLGAPPRQHAARRRHVPERFMPISVVCPSCKARFAVSEKFAGKKGPCPKCKTVITVPDKPAEEVKIHVPEQFASGGKDSKGRPVLKPIARQDPKLAPPAIAAIAGAVLVTLAVAFLLRSVHDK